MGKFSDKLRGAFNMKDDDYDDEYDDDEYEDEYEDDEYEDENEKKSGFFSKFKKNNNNTQDYDDYEDEVPRQSHTRSSGNSEVCVFKPSSIEDAREITETLLHGKAVVINFEGLHVEISQRIIDFISGSCYALNGNLQKISNYIFIATPDNVDISGDVQDLLGNKNSFDISGFKSPLI